MATKRSAPKAPSTSSSPPIANAVLLGLALCYGVGLLFAKGKLDWPPTELMANSFTVAGCLALVGPILLHRRDSGEIGLGELLWMAGGLVIWVFDAAAIARGEARSTAWATPLGYQPMGLTILAVLLAGWRGKVAASSWSWTNVTGWSLGVFWVAMAAWTLVPHKMFGLASR